MSESSERNSTATIPQPSVPGGARSGDIRGGRSNTPSSIYRDLRLKGFARDEAGNLTAYLIGIRPVESGWRPSEIEHLLFLRHLVEGGWGDERAAS